MIIKTWDVHDHRIYINEGQKDHICVRMKGE